MTTRQELYEAVASSLHSIPEVRHIDLWNRNVEFVDQDTPWDRPAVFIEIAPIKWEPRAEGCYRAEVQVRLHIVTDWAEDACSGCPADGIAFELPDTIRKAIDGISGDTFCDMRLEESHTNHDHEEIVESIEVYSCIGSIGI